MIRLASFTFAVVIFCLVAAGAVSGTWPLPAGLAGVAFGLLIGAAEFDLRRPW